MGNCQWNLKPFQSETLNIFKEFSRICDKYGLAYYAMYGTALGAIRHKGFIPWDDDFDVVMPRSDYNRFAKIVSEELPSSMEFCRGGEYYESPIYFSKIRLRDMRLLELLSRRTGLNVCSLPWIDIFALDGIPENIFDMKKWFVFRKAIRACQIYRYPKTAMCSGRTLIGRFKVVLAWLWGMFESFRYPRTQKNSEMMLLMDSEFDRRWPYDKSSNVVEWNFFRMKASRMLPREYFEPARVVPFEDTLIRVPRGVEEILSRYYGDFMKFPDPESRIPAHLLKKSYREHI